MGKEGVDIYVYIYNYMMEGVVTSLVTLFYVSPLDGEGRGRRIDISYIRILMVGVVTSLVTPFYIDR